MADAKERAHDFFIAELVTIVQAQLHTRSF